MANLSKHRPNAGDIKAEDIIATAYSNLLTALGHPDELGRLPEVKAKLADIIAVARREMGN